MKPYYHWEVNHLTDECRLRGLPAHGKILELLTRLIEHDQVSRATSHPRHCNDKDVKQCITRIRDERQARDEEAHTILHATIDAATAAYTKQLATNFKDQEKQVAALLAPAPQGSGEAVIVNSSQTVIVIDDDDDYETEEEGEDEQSSIGENDDNQEKAFEAYGQEDDDEEEYDDEYDEELEEDDKHEFKENEFEIENYYDAFEENEKVNAPQSEPKLKEASPPTPPSLTSASPDVASESKVRVMSPMEASTPTKRKAEEEVDGERPAKVSRSETDKSVDKTELIHRDEDSPIRTSREEEAKLDTKVDVTHHDEDSPVQPHLNGPHIFGFLKEDNEQL